LGVKPESVEGAAREACGGLKLVGGPPARGGAEHGGVDAAVRVDECAQGERLPGAGDPDDADNPVRPTGGLMDEHPLLARQLVACRHERFGERPPFRRRHRDVEAGEGELDRFPLDRQQFAGREACRLPGRLLRSDELDTGETGQLVCELEHLVDACARGQRAGDCLHQLGHDEGGLLLGDALAAKQVRSELLELNPIASDGPVPAECLELAPAEPVLGRARLPVLTQPR
jgi:hypothetical protein